MIFELGVLIITLVFLLLLQKMDKNTFKLFGLTFLAVLLFEYFTQALWLNNGLEPWAYLYLDVSWIITLGWATIILVSRKLVELYFPTESAKIKFVLDLVAVTIIGFFAEWVVLGLGIREYSTAALNAMGGGSIGPVPVEAIYYIPVFMALVITFSMYWEHICIPSKTKGSASK